MAAMSKESMNLTKEEAEALTVQAGTVFTPRTPISTRELFSGRLEQLEAISDAVSQIGLHVVLFGERGVGKTSLANIVKPILSLIHLKENFIIVKINVNSDDGFSEIWSRSFDEIYWDEEVPVVGFGAVVDKKVVTLRGRLGLSGDLSIDDVRKALSVLPGSVFIFDEFDRGGMNMRKNFTDLVKTLSDYSIDSTVILVGVSETIGDLLADHASIGRSITQIHLPRMREDDLKAILSNGANLLKVSFEEDAVNLIVGISQGLPHYTHLIGLYSVREAAKNKSKIIGKMEVLASFKLAVSNSEQSIKDLYSKATHSARKDALYEQVLLGAAAAAAKTVNSGGFFHPSDLVVPLKKILGRDKVVVATFQRHINEFCEEGRASVLERMGSARSYKYRFANPLLPPYVFMNHGTESLDLLY